MLWIGKHRNEAKRQFLAAENNETIIEMLDDVDNAIGIEEFRPRRFYVVYLATVHMMKVSRVVGGVLYPQNEHPSQMINVQSTIMIFNDLALPQTIGGMSVKI